MPKQSGHFYKIKGMADAWSFSDNDVSKENPPKLIAKKGKLRLRKEATNG